MLALRLVGGLPLAWLTPSAEIECALIRYVAHGVPDPTRMSSCARARADDGVVFESQRVLIHTGYMYDASNEQPNERADIYYRSSSSLY